MTEPTPDLLERLDAFPISPAPLDDIINGGQALRARRRRTVVASVAAAVVLLVGGSAVATQTLHDSAGRSSEVASDPDGDTTGRTAKKLDVEIAYVTDARDDSSFPDFPSMEGDALTAQALFRPDTGNLVYLSPMSYSGSCAPVGRATIDDEGRVRLTIVTPTRAPGDSFCTSDARAVVATISGIDDEPRSLTVTDDDGTREVPVGQ